MTILRRLAMRIAEEAVERAKPRCKEWAEGLEREVAFIESDWRALGWAIGSVRVLFQNPPKPLGNSAEIARAGRLFAGWREHVPPVIFLIMAMQVFNNGLRVVLPTCRTGPLGRAGFAIAAVSAAYLAVVGWMDSRMRERPEDMDDGAWIEFYRLEMVRLRDLYAGLGALFSAAIFLFCAAEIFGLEGLTLPYLTVCMIAFCMFLAWLSPRPAERFQQKIDDVDSILRQGGEA